MSLALTVLVAGAHLAESRRQLVALLDGEGRATAQWLAASLAQDKDLAGATRPVPALDSSALARDWLAYLLVVDSNGRVLRELRHDPLGAEPWTPPATLAELGRRVELSSALGARIEWREPLLVDGEVRGYLRAGWRRPSWLPTSGDATYGAFAALFVLQLGLYGWMWRCASAPVMRVAHGLEEAMHALPGVTPVATRGSGVEALVAELEHYLHAARLRLLELGEEQQDNFARNALLGYQKRCAEAALESLPDGAMIMDESGVATYANAKIESLIGISAAAMLGRKPHEWSDHQEIVALLSRYYSNVTRLRRSDRFDFSPDADGHKRVSVRALPLADLRGGSSTLVLFRDITAEALVRKSRDDFVAHVAHELKSPLNVIRMQAELLGEEPALKNGEATVALNVIEDEVDRLANLVNDLLNLSRLESGALAVDRQRVKLGAFLEDVFETTQRAAVARGLTATLDVPPRIGTVALDKDLFRVALNNLLSNAVKYNQPGGNVTLRVEDGDEALVVQVIDTGLGISERDRARIFEKFYRADDAEAAARGGHGLGLALAREIIALHNGHLSVQSEVGHGSTFTIELRKSAHLLQEAV